MISAGTFFLFSILLKMVLRKHGRDHQCTTAQRVFLGVDSSRFIRPGPSARQERSSAADSRRYRTIACKTIQKSGFKTARFTRLENRQLLRQVKRRCCAHAGRSSCSCRYGCVSIPRRARRCLMVKVRFRIWRMFSGHDQRVHSFL